jgi:hypothetical protein
LRRESIGGERSEKVLRSAAALDALATTSAGFANSPGRLDDQITRDEVIEHCRQLSAATVLPVSADLENCFADDPAEATATIVRAASARPRASSPRTLPHYLEPRIFGGDSLGPAHQRCNVKPGGERLPHHLPANVAGRSDEDYFHPLLRNSMLMI